MQDPSSFQPIKTHIPEQEQPLKCPRCDSTNTKFCYYNNYNLSQPRHFCKNCKRYWTKGGALRNIPVGGGGRKNTKRSSNSKRPASSSSSALASAPAARPTGPEFAPVDQERLVLDMSGGFSSLLATNEHFGNLLEGLNSNELSRKMVGLGEFRENLGSDPGPRSNSDTGRTTGIETGGNSSERFLGPQSSDWNSSSSNGWPSLAIYTPGSNFQ